MPESTPDALFQIQQCLRESASRGREVVRVGPLLITISGYDPLKYINYAIPDEMAEPTDAELDELKQVFRVRERLPRFEYIPQVAPKLEKRLLGNGFEVEFRTPLMECHYQPPVKELHGFVVEHPKTKEELRELQAVLHGAFSEEPPTKEALDRFEQSVEDGMLCLFAREDSTRKIVAGGQATAPANRTMEVAGIGVDRPYRRRGLGAWLTSAIASKALENDIDFVFLMAAAEEEARVYARAGFQQIGEVLHISAR